MGRNKDSNFDKKFNVAMEAASKQTFTSMLDLVEWFMNTKPKIDWLEIDKMLNIKCDKKQGKSYEYFHNTTIPNTLPAWSEESL